MSRPGTTPIKNACWGSNFRPTAPPMADGEQVLDILATHPGTARFICTKLARRLLTDTPDASAGRPSGNTFLNANDAPDQIAQVIRALVPHPGFAATPPSKTPPSLRISGRPLPRYRGKVTGTNNAQHWQLMRAGWRQHEYPIPTGHPDVLAKWIGPAA